MGTGTLKVDRVRGIAYVLTSSLETAEIRQLDLNDPDSETTPLTNLTAPYAFAVAPNGSLIVYRTDSDELERYNPATGDAPVAISVTGELPLGDGVEPFDLTLVGDTLFLLNGTPPDLVYGIDDTFTLSGSFGSFIDGSTAPGSFYGPLRFLDSNADGVFVSDMDPTPSPTVSRIVGFRDATGANWTTYGTQGSGVGQFDFFTEGGQIID